MVYVPSIYRTADGPAALTRDYADLSEREIRLLAELEDVRANKQLMHGYMTEIGISPPTTPEPLMSNKGNLVNSTSGQVALFQPAAIMRAPKTWREFIAVALRQSPRSMTTKEIIACDNGGEFADRYKVGPNGFYNTLGMMDRSGELVKVGRRYYDPVLYSRIQSGEISEDLPIEATRDSIPNIILRALREHGSGLTAAGVITALGRLPETSAIADKNPALIRTHLTKMKQAAKLINDNGQYKLPEWSREIPSENITLFPGSPRG